MAQGAADASKMMVAPEEPFAFTFVYAGDPLTLEDATVAVLRRQKGSGAASADAVRGIFPNLADFGRFENLKVQTVSAFEDKPYGMTVYADTLEESISISQHYPRWPHPEQNCRDQACYESFRIRESDLPSDAEAIAAAETVLAAYGISKEGYAAPEVRTDWRRWYELMADKSQYWFPEAISVTYPMLSGGMRVVDESGASYGMTVNVNVREDRADGVWNLYSKNYESSAYDAETDSAAILAAAARGGVNGWQPEAGSGVRMIEVRLGTPERVMLRTWQYGGDGSGRELLVPALRFPALDATAPYGVPPEAVVIPLAKELLVRQGDFGIPMPLTRDAGAETTVTDVAR